MNRLNVGLVAAFAMITPAPAHAGRDAPPAKPLVVRALTFSPEGKVLVAGYGSKDQPGGVGAWNVVTRKPVWRRPEALGVPSVSFAPDGKSLAIAHGTSTALRLDLVSGQTLGELGPHAEEVRAVAHIVGTDLLATGSDGTIRLWDVKTAAVRKELQGHPKEVRTLVASPEGRWLVSTGRDTTRIWNLSAGEELKGVINQDRGFSYSGVAFVGTDRVLLGNNHGIQRVIELPAGKELLRFKNSGGYAGTAHSPAAGLAAYRGIGGPQVWIADLTFRAPTADEQARIEKLLKDYDDESYEIREAASATMRQVGTVAEPALRRAMTDGPSPEVRMRAREDREAILNEPLRRLNGSAGGVGPMAFSPDGKLLATGGEDGTIRLWDPQTGRELARLDVSVQTTKSGP